MSARDPDRKPFDIACPTCHVQRGQACRTRSTRRVTDTHTARFDKSYGIKGSV